MTIDNQNASRFGGDFTDLWITVDVDDLEGGLIPGHGHYLPEECPEELTRRLLTFLRGEG